MRKIALSAIVALGLSGVAMAGGDIAPVAPAPADSWSGFYVGIQTGYNWGDAKVDWVDYDNTGAVDEIYAGDALDVDGSLLGFYGGYNWLLDNGFLVGIEGEFNEMGAKDVKSVNYPDPIDGPNAWLGKVEQQWDASLRLRAGKVIGDLLPYITGGVAWGRFNVKQYYYLDPNDLWYDKDITLTGWTLGGGVEWAISPNIHARLQYRYTDYGDKTVKDDVTPGGGWSSDARLDYNAHMITVGLSYRF